MSDPTPPLAPLATLVDWHTQRSELQHDVLAARFHKDTARHLRAYADLLKRERSAGLYAGDDE